MKTVDFTTQKIVAISDLRKRFGEIEEELPFVDHFVLTKKGKPFAILSATPQVKRNLMEKTAGAFKDTSLANEDIWKEVLKRKSRKEKIRL